MVVAALGGGLFNMASNFIAQRMPEGQFNIFDTALSALGILGIPALGMQASFAAQTAGVDNEARRRELAATVRGALTLLGASWVILTAWWYVRQQQIMAAYSLSQPAMLWLVLFICLLALLSPVPSGVLQGREDFLWFGWATLLNGMGRFAVLLIGVRGLGWGALGGLGGVLAGTALVTGIVTWRAWDGLTGPAGRFEWRAWLKRLLPVTVGLGALSFMMQADALIVREKLQPLVTPDEMDGYSAVRKIAQAMVFLVGALTSVMFPKVARSFQRSEKTEALKLTVAMTVGIGVAGAILATIFPELPLRLLSPDRLLASKVLVPAYCWALVPVALANVLVWSLLARECYRVVPWLAALAVGYWLALLAFHQRFLIVISVTAAFGTALLVLCSIFLWRGRAVSESVS
jgi:O-antigen/teichoic acid export membrane protein